MAMCGERVKRQLWVVSDGAVREVTGYSCILNRGVWWCPEVGFSSVEGSHVFMTRDEAFKKAISEAERYLAVCQKRLENLRRQKAMP